ncbi:MAG: 50S ribosomal protein L19e [Candidatus Bathyarchaeota archaeon]
MSLKSQKRLASKILKVGVNRVWINPEKTDYVEGVITRTEIRKLTHEGTIRVLSEKGVSRVRAKIIHEKKKRGLRKGPGSKKGRSTARTPRKKSWENRIRAIRRHLRGLRERRIIQQDAYRKLYLLAKGGAFPDVSHVEQYIDLNKLARRR